MKNLIKNLTNSRTLVLLDAGHGKETPGKRSPVWKDGTQLFEWEFNRDIVDKIHQYLVAASISSIKLINTDEDVSLSERTSWINTLYKEYKDRYFVYLFSIHGNAFDSPKTHGIEAFTSVGNTTADVIADITLKELESLGWYMRYNNKTKLNKDYNYWILKNTHCPSVLTENGFYTNEEECKKMLDPYWKNKIALCHVSAIIKIEFDGTIV